MTLCGNILPQCGIGTLRFVDSGPRLVSTSVRTLEPNPSRMLERRVRQVCEAVGDFIEYWGFKSVYGRVWTLLALSEEPRTQSQVAEFFGISRSLVSAAVHELLKLGLVRATHEHRNAPYEAVIDVWPTVSDVLREREWMLIETARVALEGAIEEGEYGDHSGFDIERMRFLLKMTELAQSFLKLLIGLRVPRKLEGVGSWLRSSASFFGSLRGR